MEKIYLKYKSSEKGSYLDLELTKNEIYQLKDLQIYEGCVLPLIENDNGDILAISPSHIEKFEVKRC